MLLDAEQSHGGPGPCWEVIQLEDHASYKSPEHMQSIGDAKTLAFVVEDLTTNFKEQLQELATCYNVSPSALSRLVAGKIFNLQGHHVKPLTSTPKAATDPPQNTENGRATAEGTDCVHDISAQGTSPILAVPAEVQRVVVEHIVKHGPELHTPTQRKLRLFSGNLPRPSNEVEFSIWRLHARQVINDVGFSVNQQRQILIDSLLPPALNVALCVGENASPKQYIRELENAYGSVTDGEELYIQFLETHQSSGEKASDYLRRLHTVLQEVVERNGISTGNTDAHLIKQFIRGCWDDALIVTLRLKESLCDPLSTNTTFSELLMKIRSHEQEIHLKEMRKKRYTGCDSAKVHTKTHVKIDAVQAHNSPLSALTKAELEERVRHLEAEVAKTRFPTKGRTGKAVENVKVEKEIEKLPTVATHSQPDRRPKSQKFCYRCGAPAVEQAGAHDQYSSSFSNHGMSKFQKTDDNFVPDGLEGESCEGTAWLDGVQCSCLIDTGSQVSIIAQSFYLQHLSHRELCPVSDLLHIEGAAGQTVPYLGYVEVEVQFPKSVCGTGKRFNILALISPDQSYNEKVPLLVGTNILKHLIDDCKKKGGVQFFKSLPIKAEWAFAYLDCCQKMECESRKAYTLRVKLNSKSSVHIKPNEVCMLKGICHTKFGGGRYKAIISEPQQHSVPGGLIIFDQVVDVKPVSHNSFKLIVQNASTKDITLPPKAVIAECAAVDWALPLPSTTSQWKPAPVAHSLMVAQSEKPVSTDSLGFSLDFEGSPVSPEFKAYILNRIHSEAPNAFARHDLDVGTLAGVTHRIELEPHMPFKERTRRVSPADFEDLKCHLQELLVCGIIEESTSPYASPVVLVRKKNGDLRMVVDYRKLNKLTKKDAYPLPRIEETFALLSGSRWFTVLDLKSGYYQLEVEPADRPKTAFTTPFGTWQFRKLPQGLTNSPATFQRTMERVMAGINLQEVIAFLDDLIIFSSTLEEHKERLMTVLKRLSDVGLKLSPAKCKFFQKSVHYLGHVISEEGIQPDPGKVSAIKNWPKPTSVKELRSFLGFAGYYRRFVRDFSKLAKPLNDLLKGEFSTRHKSSGHKHKSSSQALGGRWTQDCQNAFEVIVEKLTSAPVLGFADWKLPYVLHTDASTIGLGAALYQVQDGKPRVIAYASRGLSKSEKNYPAHKLEFLALKWAISEKFHDYLYGSNFKVLTDNNPLTYVLTSAKLDATGHRWLAAISMYNFDIHYKSGKNNLDADGLSRIPCGEAEEDADSEEFKQRVSNLINRTWQSSDEFNVLEAGAVGAVCMRHDVRLLMNTVDEETQENGSEVPAVETLLCNEDAVPENLDEPEPWPGQPSLPSMTQRDWHDLQRADASLARMIEIMERGVIKETLDVGKEVAEVRLLLREHSKLVLKEGVLYRKIKRPGGETFYQLVIPQSHRGQAFEGVHDEVGHMGFERTIELARARFYWPKMTKYVEDKCKTCERCVRRKARAQKAAKLVNIKVQGPLELVCMDFLTLEPDSKDIRNILVLTDYFTKYSQAFPTRDQTAKTVATVLWENFISHYGFPRRLHSDQGANFESEVVSELCKLSGVKSRTTPYHPRGNPVERFNRTLLDLLGTLSEKKKENWRKYVKPLVHAYNCTRNDTTGEAPFLLMFGRQPRLPIDLSFGISPEGHHIKTHSTYVRDLKNRLKQAYRLASENAEKHQLMNKRRWDAKVTAAVIEEGDRVLIRNLGLRRKHKIADRWEPNVYVVVRQPDENIPVYVVREENSTGRERILHRDLLLPCGFLPAKLNDDDEEPGTNQRPVTRASQPVAEKGSSDESLEKMDLSGTEASVLSKEDKDGHSETTLNPDAPEFFLDSSEWHSEVDPEIQEAVNSSAEFEEEGGEREVEDEPAVTPVLKASRPCRKRLPPAYLSDYEIGYGASCKQQMVVTRPQDSELCSILTALKRQIEILAQSLREGTNGDVRI
ncbi:hypothetical protein SRHO_G00342580 [Serrasalmus rhombeus]